MIRLWRILAAFGVATRTWSTIEGRRVWRYRWGQPKRPAKPKRVKPSEPLEGDPNQMKLFPKAPDDPAGG